MTITDEQAKIIGQEIGLELGQSLRRVLHDLARPVGRPSFTDEIRTAVERGFDKIATAVRERGGR